MVMSPYRRVLRVLSFDGGGMRGYLSLCWLKLFITLWGIAPQDLAKYFDVICGSSIGGIMGLAIAFGKTPEEIAPFFLVEGPWIFTIRTAADLLSGSNDASEPCNTPNAAQKMLILGNNDYYYSSVSEDSNYGSARLARVLKDTFGTATLQDLKTNVLVTSYRNDTKTPILFSNLSYPNYYGQNALVSDVARATSAAPVLYFDPAIIDGQNYIDGGTYLNNPSQLGVTMAKMLYPNYDKICLLSLGTGLGDIGYDEAVLTNLLGRNLGDYPYAQVVNELNNLISMTMTAAQESVALSLSLEAAFGSTGKFYQYRFQTDIDPTITQLDIATSTATDYLENLAATCFNADIANISNFIGHLAA